MVLPPFWVSVCSLVANLWWDALAGTAFLFPWLIDAVAFDGKRDQAAQLEMAL